MLRYAFYVVDRDDYGRDARNVYTAASQHSPQPIPLPLPPQPLTTVNRHNKPQPHPARHHTTTTTPEHHRPTYSTHRTATTHASDVPTPSPPLPATNCRERFVELRRVRQESVAWLNDLQHQLRCGSLLDDSRRRQGHWYWEGWPAGPTGPSPWVACTAALMVECGSAGDPWAELTYTPSISRAAAPQWMAPCRPTPPRRHHHHQHHRGNRLRVLGVRARHFQHSHHRHTDEGVGWEICGLLAA